MAIREAVAQDEPAVDALTLARCPHTESWVLDNLFVGQDLVQVLSVATDGDRVVGYAYLLRIPGVPEHRRSCHVLVAEDAGGRGVGRALFVHLLDRLPASVTELRTHVYRGDDVALAVARHWGFEVVQLSITSRRRLGGEAPAEPPEGVTLEAVDDLEFADLEAVDAMFAASQTNPEATNSHLMTIAGIRGYVFPGERGIATLARVHGEPAALCFAIAGSGEEAGVVYTGVDPRHRGQGLGKLVKQDVHHRASLSGVRTLSTDNEEHNHGIRRLNAEMGFEEVYGVYRMRRDLSAGPRPRA